jgi:hypothetical protein
MDRFRKILNNPINKYKKYLKLINKNPIFNFINNYQSYKITTSYHKYTFPSHNNLIIQLISFQNNHHKIYNKFNQHPLNPTYKKLKIIYKLIYLKLLTITNKPFKNNRIRASNIQISILFNKN